MGIDIQIRIDLTPRQKKVMRGAVVTGVVIGALGVGLAIAAPHQWSTNDPLKASDLNGLNVATYTSDGGTTQQSVGTTKFCGLSATTTTGAISYSGLQSYAAAKKMCEVAPGCSATAHMCTGEEIVRSGSLGIPAPASCAWYAGSYRADSSIAVINDCAGYTFGGSAANSGPAACPNGSAWNWSYSGCNASMLVACCD